MNNAHGVCTCESLVHILRPVFELRHSIFLTSCELIFSVDLTGFGVMEEMQPLICLSVRVPQRGISRRRDLL